MTIGTYEFYNTLNNKSYIGSSFNIEKRKIKHLRDLRKNKHFNKHLQRSFNKYGEHNFVFTVIEICDEDITDNDLRNKESLLIEQRGLKNCYNECPVGGSTKGRMHSEETKNKISKKNLGRKINREIVKYLRNINLGRKHSEASKKNMSLSKIGCKIDSTRKVVLQIDMHTKEVLQEFSCGQEASIATHIDSASISRVCNNKAKQAGGYIWQFKK